MQHRASLCRVLWIFVRGFGLRFERGRFYEIAGLCECPSVELSGIRFYSCSLLFFTRVISISRELVNLLASNGVVLGFIHVLFIFFASPKKTNQKKRAFFLGIFALPGKTARSPLNFLQGFENF